MNLKRIWLKTGVNFRDLEKISGEKDKFDKLEEKLRNRITEEADYSDYLGISEKPEGAYGFN